MGRLGCVPVEMPFIYPSEDVSDKSIKAIQNESISMLKYTVSGSRDISCYGIALAL